MSHILYSSVCVIIPEHCFHSLRLTLSLHYSLVPLLFTHSPFSLPPFFSLSPSTLPLLHFPFALHSSPPSPSLALSLHPSLFLPPSLTHSFSLPPSLPPSLPLSLSLPPSLPHSLTPSLPCPLPPSLPSPQTLPDALKVLCEILTPDSEGGPSRIPLDQFCSLYAYLAAVDGEIPTQQVSAVKAWLETES